MITCPFCDGNPTVFIHPFTQTPLPFINQKCSKCDLPCKFWKRIERLQNILDLKNGVCSECLVCGEKVPFSGAVYCSEECSFLDNGNFNEQRKTIKP